MQQNESCNDVAVVHRRQSNQLCSNLSQIPNIPPNQWRHSDSHYGFRTGPPDVCRSAAFSHLYPHIHHPHEIPQIANNHHQLLYSLGLPNNRTSLVSSQHDRFNATCHRNVTNGPSNFNPDHNILSAMCSSNLPRYMWGPPPPYSQPTSLDNVNSEESAPNNISTSAIPENNANLEANESVNCGVSPSITTQRLIINSDGSPIRNNLDSQPNLTRTTKSGILLSPTESNVNSPLKEVKENKTLPDASLGNSTSCLKQHSGSGSIRYNNSYDDSIDSAMHIYEQAKDKDILQNTDHKSNSIDKNCNSLPLRRIRKRLDLALCKSEANLRNAASIEEENLVKEVRQKLNELGLYKYQRSKASRELAEIRQALSNLQNPIISQKIEPRLNSAQSQISHLPYPKQSLNMQSLPLPPIPIPSASSSFNGSTTVYQAPSIVSSACSTNENKYETIGKSINPYKITSDDKKVDENSSNTSSSSDCTYGFIASSTSPMSNEKNKSGLAMSEVGEDAITSDTTDSLPRSQISEEEDPRRKKKYFHKPYKRFKKKESSHYAQISPLRGQGAPEISSSGLSIDGQPHVAMSYFKVRFYISFLIES